MPEPATAARSEYEQRLKQRRESFEQTDQQHQTAGYVRLALVVGGLAAISSGFGWWAAIPAAGFLAIGFRLEALANRRARIGRAIACYERALARLDGNWAGCGETGQRFADEHHIYARDLDLFGAGSLFQLLCAARTRMGEETLADWLKAHATPDAVRMRQEAVKELVPRLDLREQLGVVAEDARAGLHPRALADWCEREPVLAPGWFQPVAWLLSVAGAGAVTSLLLYFAAEFGVVALSEKTLLALRVYFLGVLVIYSGVLWRFHRRTDRILLEAAATARELRLLAGVLERLERETFHSERLAALRRALDAEGAPPSRQIAQLDRLMVVAGNRRHALVAIIGPMLLWDLHLAYALERWRRRSGTAMRMWLEAVGEIEALVSFAGFHYENPEYVFVEFSGESPCFEAEQLCHPLIAQGAVANDIKLDAQLRVLVVSGSNMSGKSTWLRSIGVAVALAQAGAPVRAKRLRMSPVAVAASIQVHDSLQAGESRFYAEITRLRQVMDTAASNPPALFLIDEFLHGTNSHDRRIGAQAIVRGLVERGAIGLVTTHDLALAQIAESLGEQGANVHFEDHMEDGKMQFDYRLRQGVVEKSNAIALMRSVGLDV
ncbi:MAG: DNA mismatch repair protein MutS [Acidimicrobiia bacterium]|nr:DNA mismatch repair protein MutS [Acidimicrobiia bacterium]